MTQKKNLFLTKPEEAKKFIEWLRESCNRYKFVRFIKYAASTEEEMNKKVSNSGFRIYGFKFPLGKEGYSIVTERAERDKKSVIGSKREVDNFWENLSSELSAYELLSVK